MQVESPQWRRRLADGREKDDGFSLVELIVTMIVGVILLGIVGVLFMMIFNHQRQVLDTSEATTQSQAAFRGIQGTVRNAGNQDGAIHISSDGDFLVANTRGISDSGTTLCEAWFYEPSSGSAVSGKLWFKRTALTPISEPTTADLADWILFVDNVARLDWDTANSLPVFSFGSDQGGTVSSSLVDVRFVGLREAGGELVGAIKMERVIAKQPQAFGGASVCTAP